MTINKPFSFVMKFLLLCYSLFLLSGHLNLLHAQIPLQLISGADGEFNTITLDGKTVYQSKGTPGAYAPYIYAQCVPPIVNKTVYVELTFKDIGYGKITIDYNSTTSDYQTIDGKNTFLLDLKGEKTMVFELRDANFRNAQNMGCDLRIWSETKIQKHLISAFLYESPTALWQQYNEKYFGLYQGRKYTGTQKVDATTLNGKVICGYQGWFRAPGDPEGGGWVHYFRGQDLTDPTVEMWPDMEEYAYDEKYPVPGWTLKDGKSATVFSSANKKSVLRHFQWMQAYGIHGVAVQRFVGGLYPGHPKDYYRIPSYAREAANRTGRTFYIMYDQSGVPGNLLVEYVRRDWKILVDSMKITKDERYLHHNGKPIVSIFGYWSERFTPQEAAQLAAIFKEPGYEALIIGSGDRIQPDNTAWNSIYNDFFAYFPWNVGNYTSLDFPTAFVQTQQWSAEKSFLESRSVKFMPLVFPGFGWDNLMNQVPGTTKFGRRKGEVMWKEIKDAAALNVNAMYIAMFDEIDESTAIFKITDNIPVNHYYTDNEGLPSDFYLSLTGYASSIIAGERAMPSVMPDFAAMSQPSIPELIFPQHLDTINSGQSFSSLWTPSVHKTDITEYQLKVDNQIYNLGKVTTSSLTLSPGWHTISVRAKNGLGNYGGWSEVNEVYARDAATSVSDMYVSELSVQIFPNPAKTSFYIATQTGISQDATINMLSQDGKLLHTEKVILNGRTELKIPDSAKASSFIYLHIQAGQKTFAKKIVLTQ
jgi:hypothetical protein